MDDAIGAYFEAWNETDSKRRRSLLEQSIMPDAELVDPTGRWRGIEGFSERIGNYLSSAPGTRVVPSSSVDALRPSRNPATPQREATSQH